LYIVVSWVTVSTVFCVVVPAISATFITKIFVHVLCELNDDDDDDIVTHLDWLNV